MSDKPDDGLAPLRAQYWAAVQAKSRYERELADLNLMVDVEKARRGDMSPDDVLQLFPKKEPQP